MLTLACLFGDHARIKIGHSANVRVRFHKERRGRNDLVQLALQIVSIEQDADMERTVSQVHVQFKTYCAGLSAFEGDRLRAEALARRVEHLAQSFIKYIQYDRNFLEGF